MNTYRSGKEILAAIFKHVLENRCDVHLSESSIHQLTDDTMESTPARQIIGELITGQRYRGENLMADSLTGTPLARSERHAGNTFKLSREIEILAIVTNMIDLQSHR
jgi:hypothetical protein